MRPDTYRRHVTTLARETQVTPAAVETVTDHFAANLCASAVRAETKCPGEGDWLGTVLACNAAANKHARAIVEHKTTLLFNAWKARTAPVA